MLASDYLLIAMFFFLKKLIQKFRTEVYLDNASTTPIDHRVIRAMNKAFWCTYGNPGGLYQLGIRTKHLIHESRKKVAAIVATTPEHIIFTRGGTEANNLAIIGTVKHFTLHNPGIKPHIITTTIEHDSILEVCRELERTMQAEVTYAPCDAEGVVSAEAIKKELRPETILVSVQYANNEIGTIQPIRDIAKLLRWWKKQPTSLPDLKKSLPVQAGAYPLLHTDAIQAVNYCDINVLRLGVDLMTVSGSKIYGPKSSGALFVKDRRVLSPTIFGGGQESGLRSGTEDVALIIGFAKALELSQIMKESETHRLTSLRDHVTTELLRDSRITLNGSQEHRLPNNINISIKGLNSEQLVIDLAARGFAVSAKSACQADRDEESHVIAALRAAQGIASAADEGSLRITLGRKTTKHTLARFLRNFRQVINR
jgi:cysteine desulfurase